MKIMIVDDNKGMREVLKSVLMSDSPEHEIFECSDGWEAIRNYNLSLPDIVLMDISMNGLDGISAVRTICLLHPKANIIMLTDYGDEYHKSEAKLSGAAGFILKENLLDVLGIINKLKSN